MDRILAFGCHPDDVEYHCAGTLALLAEAGYEIHIATVTGGEVGSPNLAPQEIRARRLAECKESAAVLGGHYHYAGGYDVEVDYNPEYRRRVTRVMREADPLIVFTNPPLDYMIDHEETSRLVRNAAYVASVPNYDCGVVTTPTKRIPHLYYWNASGRRDIFGRPLPINRVVDITSVMDTKTRMLACHASQREWLAYHNDWEDFVDMMKNDAAIQGGIVGVAAAEGFVQHLGNNYPQDNILKEILGDLCVELSTAE